MQITLEVENTRDNLPVIDALLVMLACREEVTVFGIINSVKKVGGNYEFNLEQGL